MSYFFNACQQLFREPLYRYRDRAGRISVLLCSENHAALEEYLTAAASCCQMLNEPSAPRITLCAPDIERFRESLYGKAPMLRDQNGLPFSMGTLEFVSDPPADIPYIFAEEGFSLPETVLENAHVERIFSVSEVDEELDRLTCNCHYIYEAGNAVAQQWNEMEKDLKANEHYYKSSMLQAAHIPYKLHCCGIDEADFVLAAQQYERKIAENPDIIGNMLYLEHNRWMVWMIFDGWRLPSQREMRTYAFVLPEERENRGMIREFRHKTNHLHPSLTPCGTSLLLPRNKDWWDNYRPDGEEYRNLDKLDHSSLALHQITNELAEKHLPLAWDLIRHMNETVSGSAALAVKRLSDALTRLESKQNHAQNAFAAALESARDHLDGHLLDRLSDLTASVIERNRYRDYKHGDYVSARLIGFTLLFRRHFSRLIRVLSERQEDNAAALTALDPELVCFVVPADLPDRDFERLKRSLSNFVSLRKMRARLCFTHCRGFTQQKWREAVECVRSEHSDLTADFTGASAGFVLAADDMNALIADKGQIRNFRGCEGIEAFNHVERRLTVENVFALSDRYAVKGWKVGSWHHIEKALPTLFDAYLTLTEPCDAASPEGRDGIWSAFTEFIAKNMQYHKLSSDKNYIEWRPNPNQNYKGKLYDENFLSEEQAAARRINVVLNQLEGERVISDFTFEEKKDGIYYSFYSTFDNAAPALFGPNCKDDPFELEIMTDGAVRLRQRATGFTFSCDHLPSGKDAKKNALRVREAVRLLSDKKYGMLIQSETDPDFYQCLNSGVRNVLLVTGALLEDYLYWCIKTCGAYSDVQLGWEFAARPDLDWGKNEVDVVAMVDKQPVFFSCKMGRNIGLKDVDEVSVIARRYGINNPKAVFVTSCSEPELTKLNMHVGGRNRVAGEEYMGVYFIDRSILADHEKLMETLVSIADA